MNLTEKFSQKLWSLFELAAARPNNLLTQSLNDLLSYALCTMLRGGANFLMDDTFLCRDNFLNNLTTSPGLFRFRPPAPVICLNQRSRIAISASKKPV
jgi:hypothetical protein